MKNDDFLVNIDISDEMQNTIYKNVMNGKRTNDFKFRHSGTLMVLLIVGALVLGGAGASAAIISWTSRVENMPVQEKAEYKKELTADVYNAAEEKMTRAFTTEENTRLLELEKKYYNESVFPKGKLPHLKELKELKPDMIAFVEEDNKLHIPDGELTDEQLLQYIDYTAKYNKTISDNAEKVADTKKGIDVSKANKKKLKKISKRIIKAFFDDDLKGWKSDVADKNLSETMGMDKSWDGYTVNWTESDAPNANFYQVDFPKHKGGLFIVSRAGLEYYNNAKSIPKKEYDAYFEQGKQVVSEFMSKNFGFGDPDRIELLETNDSERKTIAYDITYGDIKVTVEWMVSTDQIMSVVGKGLAEEIRL